MRGFTLLAATAAGILAAGGAIAQSPADFYKGRTVTILHGFGVGGTYGKTSLALAQELKPILGTDSVIVQNRPGSGGLKMTNYSYNVAPKDGSVLLMLPDTLVVTQLTRPKAAKYEADKFTFLGGALKVNSVMVVRSDTGVKTWSDLRDEEVPFASSGVGSQTYQVPAIVNGLLGTKIKIVKGYKGSRKMLLTMEQGEVSGINLTWLSFKTNREAWFTDGFALPLIQMGPAPEADLPNVPMLSDLVAAEDRPIIGFMSTLVAIGRSLATPPGVSQEKIDFLRGAFAKAVAQPSFAASMKKSKLRVTPSTGEEIQKVVNDSLKIKPAVVAKARELLFGKK